MKQIIFMALVGFISFSLSSFSVNEKNSNEKVPATSASLTVTSGPTLEQTCQSGSGYIDTVTISESGCITIKASCGVRIDWTDTGYRQYYSVEQLECISPLGNSFRISAPGQGGSSKTETRCYNIHR